MNQSFQNVFFVLLLLFSPAAFSASFVVNSSSDAVDNRPGDGACRTARLQGCTLRAAVMESNALAGTDTITFSRLDIPGMVTLAIAGAGEDGAASGDLDVTESLTITGWPGTTVTVDAAGLDRVFHVFDADFSILNLTLTGGYTESEGGGAILFAGDGNLSVASSVFDSNSCTTASGSCNGGAILYANTLETGESINIDGSRFTGNSVETSDNDSAGGGGIAIQHVRDDPTISVTSSVFSQNTAHGLTNSYGGGLYVLAIADSATLAIDSSTFSGNSLAGDTCQGAGAYLFVGNATLQNSTFDANTIVCEDSSAGGGAYLKAYEGSTEVTLSVAQTTFSNNSVTVNSGGGSAKGGGFFLQGSSDYATLGVVNSTVSSNSVSGVTESLGGGIYVNDGFHASPDLYNMTITLNSATGNGYGGGIHAEYTTNLRNSILAGNSAGTAGPECNGPGEEFMLYYSLVGNADGCNLTSNPTVMLGTSASPISPRLGPLASNGGHTKTHALLNSSPAIDGGDPTGCLDAANDALTEDQRGLPRPIDATGSGTAVCDMGAFEKQ